MPEIPPELRRLRQVLNDVKWNIELKKSLWAEWITLPMDMQKNPRVLFDAMVWRGASPWLANHVVAMVFRSDPYSQQWQQWNGPAYQQGAYAGAVNAPGSSPGQERSEPEDKMDRWMDDLMKQIKMRNMTYLMGTAMGGAGQQPVLETRVKVGPDGQPFYGVDGKPVIEYIPNSLAAMPAAQMIGAYQRGEALDPTKMMEVMSNMFKIGIDVARQQAPPDNSAAFASMQAQVHEAQLGELRAHFAAQEKSFGAEREIFMKQLDQMSPERQAEQIERWKKAGLFGGDNLEALKLQMRYDAWKTQRGDEKDKEMARIQASAAQAAEGRAQFRDLIELGKSALTDALKPVTTAVGDGLRDRLAHGVQPAAAPAAQVPQQAPDYSKMSSQERQERLAKYRTFRSQLEAEESKIQALESPPPQ